MKHDIQIHLKNEKEVFRFMRLLIFTFLFSAVFLGLPDYIWNITWYRISKMIVPWLVAIPAIVNCVERKVKIRDLLGKHIASQIFWGIVIGMAMGIIVWQINKLIDPNAFPITNVRSVGSVLYLFFFYVFAIGPSEELIYRIAFIGEIRQTTSKVWLAVLVSDILFACAHLFQSDLENAIVALITGMLFTFLCMWKKGGFITASIVHGLYDFLIMILPYIHFYTDNIPL